MPIHSSIKDTWELVIDGTTFTLGPVSARVGAKAMPLGASNDTALEALVFIAENGGVRGWKNEHETVEKATAKDLERLTFHEAMACGRDVFTKTLTTAAEQD